MTAAAKKATPQDNAEYQSRELAAALCELQRASWYIADVSKLLWETLSPALADDGNGTSTVGIEGMFDSIKMAAAKQMDMVETVQEITGATLNWEDLRPNTTAFSYTGGPVSRLNWQEDES